MRRNMVKTLLVYGSKFGGLMIVSKYLACLQFLHAITGNFGIRMTHLNKGFLIKEKLPSVYILGSFNIII